MKKAFAFLAVVLFGLPMMVTADDALPPLQLEDVVTPGWINPDGQALPDFSKDRLRIQDYLLGLDNLQAQFTQTAADASITTGTLSVLRPGRLRFAYDKPSPLLIVADGTWLTMVDYSINQVTRWPVKDTPLKLLASKDIEFGKDIEITAIGPIDGGIRAIAMNPEKPEEGQIYLYFRDDPLTLAGWDIVDSQGLTTRIGLSGLEYDVQFTKDLFDFDDPRARPPRRGPGNK